MSFLASVLFLAILAIILWLVAVKTLAYLSRVFGWATVDLSSVFAKIANRFHAIRPLFPKKPEDAGKPDKEVAVDKGAAASTLAEPVDSSHFLLDIPSKLSFWLLECVLRIPAAFKAPFPLLFSIWYLKVVLAIIPWVIVSRVPDLYGVGPVVKTVKFFVCGYPKLLALIYLLRIFVPLDMERFFASELNFFNNKDNAGDAGRWKTGSFLCFPLLLAFFLVLQKPFKHNWFVFFLGIFYSVYCYFAPLRKNRSSIKPLRIFISLPVFGLFCTAAFFSVRLRDRYEIPYIFLELVLGIVAFLIVLRICSSIIKNRNAAAAEKAWLFNLGSWLNFCFSFVAKAILAVMPFCYYVVMDFTINTALFAVKLAAILALAWAWFRYKKLLPVYLKPSAFAVYICIVWVSTIYVQSYNRLAPTENSCAGLPASKNVRPVWLFKNTLKYKFLKGALQYDTIPDFGENAIFISFKNLSGYGAIVRVDARTGRMVESLITTNDKFPGRMFYPERLCIDRKNMMLYSSTKCAHNFQLLAVDYSNGGLKLAKRIKFPNIETTGCEVDDRTGDIYVIFLGPPSNHIILVNHKNYVPVHDMSFGTMGYADYFTLDPGENRIVAPSLDPTNLFKIYDVRNVTRRNYEIHKKTMAFKFRLPGNRRVSIPLPSLGIAYNKADGKFYFSCPFLRLVLEADGRTFRITRYVFTGRFPRKIVYSDKYRKLLVANYSGGTVDVIDADTMKVENTYKVGKLVRSVSVDRETGRGFATSGCGVFEIILSAGK